MYASHYRLTLSGTLGAGTPAAEGFAFGISLAKGTAEGGAGSGTAEGAAQPDNDQFANLVSDCQAFFSRPGTYISNAAVLKQVKLAWIGPDGKYTRDPMIADVSTPGAQSGAVTHPPQVALAVSLTSGRRGPSGKGRFYLPMPAVAVDPGTLEIGVSERDAVLASVATFLNDLGNEPNVDVLDLGPCIASTKGFNTPVTGVRVGRALDTIRSRRRSLKENYSAIAAVNSGA